MCPFRTYLGVSRVFESFKKDQGTPKDGGNLSTAALWRTLKSFANFCLHINLRYVHVLK